MVYNIIIRGLKSSIVVIAVLFATAMYAQDGIKVRGTVRSVDGEPLTNVAVVNVESGITIGVSDDFGSYSAVVKPDGTLKFKCVGYKDELVAVKGRLQIDVAMTQDIIKLQEVVVKVEAKKKVIPEPTDIEIKGNYFHLRTRFSVPKQLFRSNTRLVAQPSIYNVTTKERMYMKPLVFDGKDYNITQDRMYDYDITRDPLHDYIQVKETSLGKGDIVAYYDSLYVQRPDDDYRADVHIAMEDYNRIVYTDSFSIARGTVNPLRFLEYSFNPVEFNDSAYIPKASMQLMDSKGEVNLTFVIGKDVIDRNDPNNEVELERLGNELRQIENDEDASFQSMYVTGLSSPDGRYSNNLSLAQRRAKTAFDRIISMLSESTRNVISKGSDASVQGWDVVAEMLRSDSLTNEAVQIENIVSKYDNIDEQSRRIARLPFYRPMITEKYLPKLRKVEYSYEYSIFRYLTDDEIKALYAKDYKKLTANEFYRLIMMTKNDDEREKYCRQALERYPKFLIAANELASICLKKNKADETILAPFINDDTPQPVLYNQTLSLLQVRKLDEAYELLSRLDENDNTKLLKSVVMALNGDYEKAFGPIAARSDFDEVLMLLAMKKDQEAWDRAKSLNTGTAKEYYVKAIAANRTEHVIEALMFIESAFALDPSLKDIARIDGDILDLIPEGQQRDNE